jgi:hypothetical protein
LLTPCSLLPSTSISLSCALAWMVASTSHRWLVKWIHISCKFFFPTLIFLFF